MDADSPTSELIVEPTWRYAKFFVFVPWPIAMPSGYFQVAERESDSGCAEQAADWLWQFMPEEIANEIVKDPQRTFVVLRFHQIPQELPSADQHFLEVLRMAESWADLYLLGGIIPGMKVAAPDLGSADPIATYGTVIEATTCLVALSEGKGKAMNEAFDRCLRECAIFLESYVQTIRDLRSGFINRATVLPMVPAILIDPVMRRTEVTGLTVNDGYAYQISPIPNLTPDQATEIALRSRLSEEGEPYVTMWHWQRLAHRAFRLDGDFAAAVVFSHTAGEIFFDALLIRLAWEEINFFKGSCLTGEEVATWFTSQSPLRVRLRNRYHGRMHGGWDADRPTNPIYEWDRKVSRLRNRVVHAGYRPTEHEANDALETLKGVEAYALDMIVKDRNRTRYPLTAFMMIGRVGLDQKGLYNGKLRLSVETAPANWRQSFYAFSAWISEQLI